MENHCIYFLTSPAFLFLNVQHKQFASASLLHTSWVRRYYCHFCSSWAASADIQEWRNGQVFLPITLSVGTWLYHQWTERLSISMILSHREKEHLSGLGSLFNAYRSRTASGHLMMTGRGFPILFREEECRTDCIREHGVSIPNFILKICIISSGLKLSYLC